MPWLYNIHKNLVWFFKVYLGQSEPDLMTIPVGDVCGLMPYYFSINLLVPIHLLTTQVSTHWFRYGFGFALPSPKFSYSKSNHTHLPRTNTPTILGYFSSYWLIIMCLSTYLFKRPTKTMMLLVTDEDIATHMRFIFSWTLGKFFWHMSFL
jgi:hypothetical protein